MEEDKKHDAAKILVIDDISINVEILKEILLSQGYEPLCALSVQEALNIMNTHMPQLILSDYSMPGMNGLDFCKLLKSNPRTRDIPIIFITVADSSEEKKIAFDAGVADFIKKPFEPIEVIMRVKNQVNSYHIKQELEDYNRMMHRMVTEQKKQVDREQENVLVALAKVMERRNARSTQHLERVGYNSRLLAQSLQLVPQYESMVSNIFIDTIETAAKMHNIGKVLLSDEVYFREYSSEEEKRMALIKLHSEEGAHILEEIGAGKSSRFLEMAIEICRYHHARWDGSGYPPGVAGEDIPLSARIVAIANDFDDLMGAHYISTPRTVDESVAIINEGIKTAYDPRIVRVFNKIIKQMRID